MQQPTFPLSSTISRLESWKSFEYFSKISERGEKIFRNIFKHFLLIDILMDFLLLGFKRKEFRGKLAIAITANFKNRRTTAEAVVEEISGVAFVYKQDFFNNLYEELGIALENIVYYKDETHYFVMTTKKHSLLDRGVLKEVRIFKKL